MSFYGTLVKIFSKIKIGSHIVTSTEYNPEIDITEPLNDLLKVEITNISDNTDNQLAIYQFSQGGTTIGTINIPLDLLLKEASIVYENDKQEPGTYIKLVFRTDENAENTVYIDAAALRQTVGSGNDYIAIGINENQEITVDLTDNVKNKLGYIDTDQSITTAINTAKDEAIASARGVVFTYENGNLKISYNN